MGQNQEEGWKGGQERLQNMFADQVGKAMLHQDIFENPYGAPWPTEPPNPQQQKKKFQKPRKPRLSPKANVRSPKVNVRSSKVNARSPKVNIKYF